MSSRGALAIGQMHMWDVADIFTKIPSQPNYYYIVSICQIRSTPQDCLDLTLALYFCKMAEGGDVVSIFIYVIDLYGCHMKVTFVWSPPYWSFARMLVSLQKLNVRCSLIVLKTTENFSISRPSEKS